MQCPYFSVCCSCFFLCLPSPRVVSFLSRDSWFQSLCVYIYIFYSCYNFGWFVFRSTFRVLGSSTMNAYTIAMRNFRSAYVWLSCLYTSILASPRIWWSAYAVLLRNTGFIYFSFFISFCLFSFFFLSVCLSFFFRFNAQPLVCLFFFLLTDVFLPDPIVFFFSASQESPREIHQVQGLRLHANLHSTQSKQVSKTRHCCSSYFRKFILILCATGVL